MRTFVETLALDAKELGIINRHLHEEPKNATECLGEDEMISHTVRFSNGYEMDIKCCGVQFDERNGTNTAWAEAVLFDKDGHEVACSEVGGDYQGEWTLKDGTDTYTVTVEQAMWGVEIEDAWLGNSPAEVASTLRSIANQIDEGKTYGACPDWELTNNRKGEQK